MTKVTPSRILEINDQGKRYKQTNNLRMKSVKYFIKKCVHGTLHLFHNGLQIPMLKRTLQMLDDAHLP